MSNFIKKNTGGRGNQKIQRCVNSLLDRYSHYMGYFAPPIKASVLAKLQNARIIYRQGSDHWISSLMPIGSGFVINVNKSLPISRKRNAICHEIGHTFFFDTSSTPPRRLNTSQSGYNEELLCFCAAREMLIPSSLCKREISRFEPETIYNFEGISKLAKIFLVSSDVMACRLTHDLALLGNDWITLWYSNLKKEENVSPRSLYPKHISNSISGYMKRKILSSLRKTILERKRKITLEPKEIILGKRKKLRFIIRTELVNKQRLFAISWISPLSKLK